MKIYTRIGDGGDTLLFGGRKVRKDDPRVQAFGDVDELNAVLGWAKSLVRDAALRTKLTAVQNDLFVLGADLSAPPKTKTPRPVPRIGTTHIRRLEEEIDAIENVLPPLKNFILPGGSPAGAALHLARTVARRAERLAVSLLKKKATSPESQIYLNRLSDYLFVLARLVNRTEQEPEIPWKP